MSVIILAGTVGTGKSSLAEIVAEHFDSQTSCESIGGNKVLPLFCTNPGRCAFLLQIYFLNKRFASIRQAMKDDNSVLDRSICEDSLFFRPNADLGGAIETEVCAYDELPENMMEGLPHATHKKHPDLLVHIRVSSDTMLERTGERGRSYEQLSFDPSLYDYYKELNRRYGQWYKEYEESLKIQIDGDRYNSVEDLQAREEVLKMIEGELTEIRQTKVAI